MNWRTKTENKLELMGESITRNPIKIIVVMLLVAITIISNLPKITIDTSTEVFLHHEDPALVRYEAFKEQFAQDEKVMVIIQSKDVFNLEVLKKLKKLHTTLTQSGDELAVNDYNKQSVQKDMQKFLKLVLLMMMIFLFVVFRRISAVILPIFIVVISLLSTVGLMALVGTPITIPTQILPSFLLAIGIGTVIHLLSMFFKHLNENGNKDKAISYSLGHSGLAIIMTSLTTAAGLLSFSTASVSPVADLGIFATISVMIALVNTIILLPAILAILPIKQAKQERINDSKKMDTILLWIADMTYYHAKKILAISVVIIIVFTYFALQIQFKHDPFVGKDWGVGEVLKEIHRTLHKNKQNYYAIPKNDALIPQEFLLFENSGSDDLEDLVDSSFSKARLTFKLPWMEAGEYAEISDKLTNLLKSELGDDVEITVTGMVPLFQRTLSAAMSSMATSYVVAFVLIAIMMVILLGSVKIGLISMIPNLLPIIMTIGFMAMVDMPLDMFTMLVGAIVIGLSVDDTVHFFHNFAKYHHRGLHVKESVEKTMIGTGRALVATSIVLSLGFYVYMFASLTNLINFGILAGGAITIALFSNIILGPALLTLITKDTTKIKQS